MILVRNKQIVDGSTPTQYQLGSMATSKCSDSEEHYASRGGGGEVPAQAYDEGEVLCVYCEQTR